MKYSSDHLLTNQHPKSRQYVNKMLTKFCLTVNEGLETCNKLVHLDARTFYKMKKMTSEFPRRHVSRLWRRRFLEGKDESSIVEISASEAEIPSGYENLRILYPAAQMRNSCESYTFHEKHFCYSHSLKNATLSTLNVKVNLTESSRFWEGTMEDGSLNAECLVPNEFYLGINANLGAPKYFSPSASPATESIPLASHSSIDFQSFGDVNGFGARNAKVQERLEALTSILNDLSVFIQEEEEANMAACDPPSALMQNFSNAFNDSGISAIVEVSNAQSFNRSNRSSSRTRRMKISKVPRSANESGCSWTISFKPRKDLFALRKPTKIFNSKQTAPSTIGIALNVRLSAPSKNHDEKTRIYNCTQSSTKTAGTTKVDNYTKKGASGPNSKIEPQFAKQFQAHAKKNDGLKTGVVITRYRSQLWLKKAGLLNGIINADEAREKFLLSSGSCLALDIHGYLRYLRKVSLGKIRFPDLINRMAECPPIEWKPKSFIPKQRTFKKKEKKEKEKPFSKKTKFSARFTCSLPCLLL